MNFTLLQFSDGSHNILSQYYSLTTDSMKIRSVFDLSLFTVILSEYLY